MCTDTSRMVAEQVVQAHDGDAALRQVFVKPLYGRTAVISIENSDTLVELNQKIEYTTKIPADK